jgi:hypothetical protein
VRKRWGWIVLILLLAVPLVLLLEDFTRQVLLVEFLRIIWSVRLLFDMLPQVPFWFLFLIVVAILAVRSLLVQRPQGRPATRVEREPMGPLAVLAGQVRRGAQSAYFRWTLARHLRNLILEALAHSHRLPTDEVGPRLQAGELALPPEVEAYLHGGQAPIYALPAGLFSGLRARLSWRDSVPTVDPDLERMVQFLESQLEVQHEHRGP